VYSRAHEGAGMHANKSEHVSILGEHPACPLESRAWATTLKPILFGPPLHIRLGLRNRASLSQGIFQAHFGGFWIHFICTNNHFFYLIYIKLVYLADHDYNLDY